MENPTPKGYFDLRGVVATDQSCCRLPSHLRQLLPADASTRILDIGCGLGETMAAVRNLGFLDVSGVDVDQKAVNHCRTMSFEVSLVSPDLASFAESSPKRYDFIILSHVIEHLEKTRIIDALRSIRKHLLAENGQLFIRVPNAQSNTGCYWAFEDFTHSTLFTAGSLLYVLRSAGFEQVEFLDVDGTADDTPRRKLFRKVFLKLYRMRVSFWNYVTHSYFHAPSPVIFTYDLKVVAKS